MPPWPAPWVGSAGRPGSHTPPTLPRLPAALEVEASPSAAAHAVSAPGGTATHCLAHAAAAAAAQAAASGSRAANRGTSRSSRLMPAKPKGSLLPAPVPACLPSSYRRLSVCCPRYIKCLAVISFAHAYSVSMKVGCHGMSVLYTVRKEQQGWLPRPLHLLLLPAGAARHSHILASRRKGFLPGSPRGAGTLGRLLSRSSAFRSASASSSAEGRYTAQAGRSAVRGVPPAPPGGMLPPREAPLCGTLLAGAAWA